MDRLLNRARRDAHCRKKLPVQSSLAYRVGDLTKAAEKMRPLGLKRERLLQKRMTAFLICFSVNCEYVSAAVAANLLSEPP